MAYLQSQLLLARVVAQPSKLQSTRSPGSCLVQAGLSPDPTLRNADECYSLSWPGPLPALAPMLSRELCISVRDSSSPNRPAPSPRSHMYQWGSVSAWHSLSSVPAFFICQWLLQPAPLRLFQVPAPMTVTWVLSCSHTNMPPTPSLGNLQPHNLQARVACPSPEFPSFPHLFLKEKEGEATVLA